MNLRQQVLKAWDESKYQRVPKGESTGGQFTSQGGGGPVARSTGLGGTFNDEASYQKYKTDTGLDYLPATYAEFMDIPLKPSKAKAEPKKKAVPYKKVTSIDGAEKRLVKLGFDADRISVFNQDLKFLNETLKETEAGLQAVREVLPDFDLGKLGIWLMADFDVGAKGSAAATYTPGQNIMRIGVREGESVVHELGHYWDAMLADKEAQAARNAEYRPDKPLPKYDRSKDAVWSTERGRPENLALVEKTKTLREYKQWEAIDNMKNETYFTDPTEIVARMFDQYIASKSPAHYKNVISGLFKFEPEVQLHWINADTFNREVAPLVEAMLGIVKKWLGGDMSDLRTAFQAALDKHIGPGPHPDGSSQAVHAGADGAAAPQKTTPKGKWDAPTPFHADPKANNNTKEPSVTIRPAELKGTDRVVTVRSQPNMKRWMVSFTDEGTLKDRWGSHESGGHVFVPYDGGPPEFTHSPGGLSPSKEYKREEAWVKAMTKPNSMSTWHDKLPDWRRLIRSAESYWAKPKP